MCVLMGDKNNMYSQIQTSYGYVRTSLFGVGGPLHNLQKEYEWKPGQILLRACSPGCGLFEVNFLFHEFVKAQRFYNEKHNKSP